MIFRYIVIIIGLFAFTVHASTLTSDAICKQLSADPSDKQLLAQYKASLKTETNTVDKVHHAVIYCLGCFFTGQMAEGDALRQSILEKFPLNPEAELLATKSLTATCDQCNGTGKQDSPCRRCNNSGQCTICKGAGQKQYQGFNNSSEIKNCPGCNGTGKCKDCNGTGQVKVLCSQCSGKGVVFSKEMVGKLYVSLLNPDALETVPPSQSHNNRSKSEMTDAEVIIKAANCQMTDMSIAEASNLLVRIHQITSSIGENETIKAGRDEYAGFQIKTYEEWVASLLVNLKSAQLAAEQKKVELLKASEVSETVAVVETTHKLPVSTSVNSAVSTSETVTPEQTPMTAIIMLAFTAIGAIAAFRLTAKKSPSLRRWTALWILVPGYAIFFGSIAYLSTVLVESRGDMNASIVLAALEQSLAGQIFVAIGCGMIMTGFILLVPDIYGFFERIHAQIQEQKKLREQQRMEMLSEMSPYEREMFLLREKEVAQQAKASAEAKRERRGDRFAAAIVSSIALQKQSQAVEAQKAANRLQEEQNRLLREKLNNK